MSRTTGSTAERTNSGQPAMRGRTKREADDERVGPHERRQELLPARRRNDCALARQGEPGLEASGTLDIQTRERLGLPHESVTVLRLVPTPGGIRVAKPGRSGPDVRGDRRQE